LYVAVCVKFVTKFIESLDESTKSTPVKVEDAFRKFCKTAKGDDNRFVSKCCVFLPDSINVNCYAIIENAELSLAESGLDD